VTRTVSYRGHQIRATATPVTDSEEGAWLPQAAVRVPGPGAPREQAVPDPDDRTFPSEEDAEQYAVHLAMRWVDRHGS
jgi:hypothetical protein